MEVDVSQIVDIRLLNVTRVNDDLIDVERELVFADGTVIPGKHRFPNDTLEWRAAEYGIDPADLDTLLDMVLWEPFLPEDDNPDLSLHQAPTIEEARTHHLDRINKRKGQGIAKRGLTPDPVRDRLKGLCVMHPEAVALKAELTERARQEYQQEREAQAKARLRALVTPQTTDARVERLRAMVDRGKPTPQSFKKTKGKPNG